MVQRCSESSAVVAFTSTARVSSRFLDQSGPVEHQRDRRRRGLVEEGVDQKTLAVVEAMKMENVLRADRDLVVSKLNAKPGDSLAVDAVIMEFA